MGTGGELLPLPVSFDCNAANLTNWSTHQSNRPIGWAIEDWGRVFACQRDWERWQVDDSNETMIELASLNAFYSTQQPINHTTINREWGGCFVQVARRKLEQNSTIRLRFWFSFPMLQIQVGWLSAKFGEKEWIRDHENAATSSLVYQEASAPLWFQLKQCFVLYLWMLHWSIQQNNKLIQNQF